MTRQRQLWPRIQLTHRIQHQVGSRHHSCTRLRASSLCTKAWCTRHRSLTWAAQERPIKWWWLQQAASLKPTEQASRCRARQRLCRTKSLRERSCPVAKLLDSAVFLAANPWCFHKDIRSIRWSSILVVCLFSKLRHKVLTRPVEWCSLDSNHLHRQLLPWPLHLQASHSHSQSWNLRRCDKGVIESTLLILTQ